MADGQAGTLLDMTVGIVAHFVARNPLRPDELPGLIAAVHDSLSRAGDPVAAAQPPLSTPTAAQVRRSIGAAGVVSFIDGRTYQSLKRHVARHGFTPETYRERFGLRSDYPMVSPAYSARRSALAKAAGLGQGGRKPKSSAAKPSGKSGKGGRSV